MYIYIDYSTCSSVLLLCANSHTAVYYNIHAEDDIPRLYSHDNMHVIHVYKRTPRTPALPSGPAVRVY